jgi:hypothetical protein
MTYLDTGNVRYCVEGARGPVERYAQVASALVAVLSETGGGEQESCGRGQKWLHASGAVGSSENEVHRADQAECGPEIIETKRLSHIHDCEGNEHHQRDHFLQDLELSQRKRGIANPVGGNLKQILEESYSPAYERRDIPGAMRKIPQMRVPRERHEHIREEQQTGSTQEDRGGQFQPIRFRKEVMWATW